MHIQSLKTDKNLLLYNCLKFMRVSKNVPSFLDFFQKKSKEKFFFIISNKCIDLNIDLFLMIGCAFESLDSIVFKKKKNK